MYGKEYEIQYLTVDGEPAGYDFVFGGSRKRQYVSRGLHELSEREYADIIDTSTGRSVTAYRKTPTGAVRIPIEELPGPF